MLSLSRVLVVGLKTLRPLDIHRDNLELALEFIHIIYVVRHLRQRHQHVRITCGRVRILTF